MMRQRGKQYTMGNDRNNHTLTATAPAEPLRLLLAIFAGYMLLALLFTWPLVLHLHDAVIQRGTLPVDGGQGIWNVWWARTALLNGINPYSTNYLFYPLEIDLFYQTLSLPNALLVFPALLWSPILAFNLLALLSFGLGGLFAYCLARAVVPNRAAALLAGFVYAFTPYHLQRLWGGSLELIAVQWLPLYVLLLLRALERRTFASTLLAGLALLWTTLASQYYGLYAAIYTLFHAGLALWLLPSWRERLRGLAAAAGIGAVWLLGLLPFLWPLSELGGASIEDWYERQVYHSAAPLDFLMPHALHPLWGGLASAWQNSFHPFGLESGAALGLGIYGLCGMALARQWRRSWPWLVLALLMALLALGPELKLGTTSTGLPLPFALLDALGPFRNSSRPSVFLALMMVPVSVLVGIGASVSRCIGEPVSALHTGEPVNVGEPVRTLRTGQPVSPIRATSTSDPSSPPHPFTPSPSFPVLLLTGLVCIEALVAPWALMPLRVDAIYAELGRDGQPGAVLELPPRNNDSQYLLNQLCHGRPLVGGYLARLPAYPLLAGESAINRLWEARAPGADILPLDPATELASLGIRYVVLDLRQLTGGQIERLGSSLEQPGIQRVASPDGLAVYRVDEGQGRLAATLGRGWLNLEEDGTRRWRWMGKEAEIVLLARQEGPVRIAFEATAYGRERTLEVWHEETLLQQLTIPAAPYAQQVHLQVLVGAGQSQIALRTVAEQAPDGRELSLSISKLAIAPLPIAPGFTPAQQTIPTPLPWEGGLCSPES
jgi:hypothetical protein